MRTDCFESSLPAGPVLAARTAFQGMDWRTMTIPWTGTWRWRGYPWTEGTPWRNWYNHLLPPNSACFVPGGDFWKVVSPPSSYHPGGVQVVMGDGSVKFIAQTINADIWTAAGTRQGNEPLQLE